MELGNFSLSLSVKNIQASRQFYEKLGFTAIHGEEKENWLILRNGNCTLGLFQGMFEKNTLTFNPGWDSEGQQLKDFTDVREIQKQLKASGIEVEKEADEASSGPAHIVIKDPDGNPILLDQHV